jgi:hypothetical protein
MQIQIYKSEKVQFSIENGKLWILLLDTVLGMQNNVHI